jgi:ArsR family transcriptional regulator
MSNHRIDVDRLAEILKALGNPQRLRLFLRLLACCPPGRACCEADDAKRCVGDLGADVDIAPSTVSHHLKELKRVGLIEAERNGRNIECRADPVTLSELLAVFDPERLRREEIR